MARLYTLGFELNSTVDGVEFKNIYGAASISPATVRSGNFSGKISSLTSGSMQGFSTTTNQSGTDTYYRAYVNFEVMPTAENTFLGINPGLVYVTVGPSGVVKLYDEDGQISGTTTLIVGTWYRIELCVKKVGGGSDTVELKINGTVVATSSSRSLSVAPNAFYVGGNLRSEVQTQGIWYFDDLAINDGTGTYQKTYPGEGIVEYYFPFSDYSTTWKIGVGRDNPDGDNYKYVSNNPLSDTEYVGSSTSNQYDLYEISPNTISNLDVVSVIQVSSRWRNNVATGGTLTVAQILELPSREVASANTTLNSNVWNTNSSSTSGGGMFPRVTVYQRSASDVGYMRIGVKLVNGSSANYIEMSAIWAVVEYKERPAPPSFAPGEFVLYIHSDSGA